MRSLPIYLNQKVKILKIRNLEHGNVRFILGEGGFMKEKKGLNIVGRMVTAILFLFIVFTMFTFISSKAMGGETSLFGYQLKAVLSGSMEPKIQTGSLISIKTGGDRSRFKKGNVITYRTKENIVITHRIVKVERNGQQYITKGDNNNGADLEPVNADQIIGQYTGFTLPYVGYVTNLANSKQGAIVLFILPGILFIGYSIKIFWSLFKQVEKLKENSQF